MSPRIPFAIALALLAGCAGQLRDYVGPVSNITSPQFIRYGLNVADARCMGERLGDSLTPLQLRLFARTAGSVGQSGEGGARLTLRDLSRVANAMGDPAVPLALARADTACGVTAAQTLAREQQQAAERAQEQAQAAAVAPRPATWLNLGAAGSGQSIAVDASTLVQDGNGRTAWFRMTDPGAPPSLDAYLLAIDCAHRTINAKARERRTAEGAVAERVDYPDNPLPVEGGTVMEIAFLSMCT
jgi:hypothetical protein